MKLALELPQRQATRVLEQALRANATFVFEVPRGEEVLELTARLQEQRGDAFVITLLDPPEDLVLLELIGLYFDARLIMSGQLYLFTSTVLDCPNATGEGVVISDPAAINVVNRRRFERTNATIAARTRLIFKGRGDGFLGLLGSVSGSGLAVNMPDTACDSVALVGDELQVRFELPGFEGEFQLAAVLCSKDFDRVTEQLRVGVEFLGDESDTAELQRLRTALAEINTQSEKDGAR